MICTLFNLKAIQQKKTFDFIDHNYITSENTLLLMEGRNHRRSLIAMHLNVRSLATAITIDKLNILVTSMKNQPHVISLYEIWIKNVSKKIQCFFRLCFGVKL